ncbi:MAG: beta-propeller fold lactonase family protein [Candidatus Acidiferrum sp.]
MKLWKISSYLTMAVLAPCLLFSGCGSGSSGATVTSVSIISSVGSTLILGQSTTLTATVVGPTNLDVNWEPGLPTGTPCTYTTTTTSSTGTVTTNAAKNCPTDGSFGTLSNQQTTGTATYLAPSILPDPTKYPGLIIIITVQSVADTSKHGTGTFSLYIDSGVSVGITPTTAAVPTNEKQPFFAILTNDLQSKGVTWSLTQTIPSTTTSKTPNIYAGLPTCTVSGNASGCGSIDANGVYTAPTVVPTATTPTSTSTTPQNVTLVATSVEDPTRYALGTITITAGGPITFNGISPTIAPQGAEYWDIYLNAPNISSASLITLTDANNGQTTLSSATGQVKVLFPIPTGTVANPPSAGARIRLLASNLATAGPVTVSVTDPGQPVTTATGGVFTYNILPVRPTAVVSYPGDIIQGIVSSGNIGLTIDGGYFGPKGQLANVLFQGNTIPASTNGQGQTLSYAKQLRVEFPSGPINAGLPGLYSLSVARTTPPLPFENNPAVTDLAVFPSYATNPPVVVGAPVAAGINPSAIDIDPTLGVLAVAETGSNAVQFYTIGNGTLTALNGPVAVGKVPTGLSVNRNNHTVAVVNYQDQSVTVLPIPGAPVQAPGTPFTVDLSNALQGQVSPAPLPYAIGVDPDTNMALVAYSSTSTSSSANLGFLVNLNPNTGTVANPSNPYGCALGVIVNPGSNQIGQCLTAQVTLNSGAYPQIAMAPHGHLAFVTPGGQGALQGVDVTKASTSADIQSLTLAAGIVTVTTTASNGLVPGNSGAVLISGVPGPGTASNSSTANFNGVFTVSALSDTSFSYILNSTSSGTVTIPSGTTAKVFYGTPNLLFGGLSQTTQGIAINPVTNTAALADANATGSNGPQINLINNLDQTVSSISFFATCTFYTTMLPCAHGPELLGTADIAWQPYSNSIVSYNPELNQVSISDPVSRTRYAFACNAPFLSCVVNPQNSTDQQTFNTQTTLPGTGVATLTVVNGTSNTLKLFGGLAVDPATNQAFVVMSGSNQIDIIDLGPCKATNGCPNPFNSLKPAQISEIVVPSPNPGLGVVGGIPNATVPQGTLTSVTDLSGVQIFGSGFDGTTQVRLDGTAIPSANVQFVSSRQLTATIPASYLSFPHRYALDVVNGSGVQSNATDLFVIQAVDLSNVCMPSGGTHPSSVAIADQLANGPFSPIAVVTNSGCNNISVVDINPTTTLNGQTVLNPNFGKILNTIAVGSTPEGIAVSQPFGLAVVANYGDGTASIVNLLTNSLAVPSVATGTNPTGVAINDATGAAIVANTGSNTVSELNLGLLFGSSPATTLTPVSIGGFQQPTAVAIDPDRGTNNQGIAVVTALELVSGSAPQGALQVVDIGATTPILSTTSATGTVTAPATGIVFDPTVSTGTANIGVFYASSSGGNVISSFNPDNGQAITVNVGINPTALAINPETGAILTTNLAGQTTSIVDTTSSPLKTVETFGLPGSGQFGVAIDQFTNLAVIVDQANNRLLIFPMPN